jgi:hypothetical protein
MDSIYFAPFKRNVSLQTCFLKLKNYVITDDSLFCFYLSSYFRFRLLIRGNVINTCYFQMTDVISSGLSHHCQVINHVYVIILLTLIIH